jgi:hypothetical protein
MAKSIFQITADRFNEEAKKKKELEERYKKVPKTKIELRNLRVDNLLNNLPREQSTGGVTVERAGRTIQTGMPQERYEIWNNPRFSSALPGESGTKKNGTYYMVNPSEDTIRRINNGERVPGYNWVNQDTLDRWNKESGITIEDPWRNYKKTSSDYFGNVLSNDYMSGLKNSLSSTKKALTEAQQKRAAYDALSDEEKDELKREATGLWQKKGRLNTTYAEGIPYRENPDGSLQAVQNIQEDGTENKDQSNYGLKYLKGRPEDYDWYKEDYDRVIYDYFNGQGAYQKRKFEDEDDTLFDEIDQMWDALENGGMQKEFKAAEAEANEATLSSMGDFNQGKLQTKYNNFQEEVGRIGTINELIANAPDVSGTYDPSKVNRSFMRDNIDKVFEFANKELNAEDMNDFDRRDALHAAQFMTDKMLLTFNKYYQSGDKESANAFYQALLPYLKQLKNDYKAELEKEMSQGPGWWSMAAERIATQPSAGILGTAGTVLAMLGNEAVQDKNHWIWDLTKSNQNIQSARAEAWGKQFQEWFPNWGSAQEAGQFLNGIFYSMADNLVAVGLAGGGAGFAAGGTAAKVAEGIIQFIMSSEATASSMVEKMNAGMDPTEAAWYAVGDGIIEAITEKYSIEALLQPNVRELLGSPKAFIKYLGKNTLAEGSEEIASKLLNTGLDMVISMVNGHENELKAEMNRFMAENPEMSEQEAWRNVLLNYAGDALKEGLAGGISGLLMSGTRGVETRAKVAVENKNLAHSVLTSGMEDGANAETQKLTEDSNLNKVLEIGKGFKPGTETKEIADKIYEETGKGKPVNKADFGSLVRSIINESNDIVSNTVQGMMGQAFRQELHEMGVENDRKAAELTESLINLTMFRKAETQDLQRIADSPEAQAILSEYKMGNFKATEQMVKEAVEFVQSAQNSVMEMLTKPDNSKATEEKVTEIMSDAKPISRKNTDYLLAEGGRSGSTLETVSDGKVSDIKSVEIRQAEDQETGKKVNRYTVLMEDGREVDIADVRATDENTAKVLKFLAQDGGRTIGNNLANAVIGIASELKKGGETVENVVTDAVRMLWSEATGQKAPAVSVSTETAGKLRDALKTDLRNAEDERLQRRRAIKPGEGKVTYNGTEYGSNTFERALEDLSKEQKTEAKAIAEIAQAAGFDVELYSDSEDAGNQGSYSSDGGIRINLAGEYNTQGLHRSALATFAHEITHNLEANSTDAYNRLKQFVFTSLKNNGMNLQNELESIIFSYDRHGENIDLNGAISELVAKGCEQVLTNEQVVTQLREQNPGTFGKIREAVKDLLGRIRNAIGGMRDTSSKYAKALMGVTDELSRLWMGAYEEATGESTENAFGRYQTNLNGTNGTTQASFIEMQKKTWDDQVTRAFQGEAKKDDVYALTNPEETKGIGINVPISLRQKVFTKGKRISDGTSRSAHDLTESDFRQLKGSVINAPAKIENNGSVYIVTDQMKNGHPIVLIGKNTNAFAKGGVLDATTVGARNNISTLFGKFVDGKFVPDPGAKIFQYKENAVDLLSLSPGQFGAGPEVYDAIDKLTQKEEESKSQKSIQEDEDYEAAVKSGDTETAQRMVDEAAKAAGYTIKAWHGSDADERFNVFAPGERGEMWFASSKGTAYARKHMYNTYLKMNKPYETTYYVGKDSKFDPVFVTEEGRNNGHDGAIVHFRIDPDLAQKTIKTLTNAGMQNISAKDKFADNFTFIPNGEQRLALVKDGETLVDFLRRGMKEDLYQWYTVYNSNQIKSAETETHDDNGNLIPLSQRFNQQEQDIRYSLSEEADETDIVAENGDVLAKELPGGTITQYSRQSWENEDIEDLTRQLVDRGFKKKDVSKWIRDVNGIAKMIADNKELLDYEASPYFTMLKNNQEYVKTLDASTLCAKRLLYQGIFNEIQHLLPNTPILPEDLIKLVNMMKKKGLVTPCGICYVESRRRMLGKYASEWLKTYDGEYKPTLDEVTTTDGLAKLQAAPEGSPENKAYEAFKDAMNAKGSANPKVVQLRTDYRGEIRKMTDSQIAKVKEIGGLRVQSFSDFETVHLIDMMQAVLDMAAKDLTSQAYTKVPAFAWVFGDTGIKINLSLIGEGNGLDENGNLIFSSTEGMDFDEAMKIRNAYSKNVGTILVGMNDEHIIKAMGDDRIDFIIPFHKSGWSKAEMARVSGMSVYKDYTRFQNEKKIAGRKANGKGYQIIPNKKSKISNFGPVSASGKWDGQAGYWDFNKTGIENAEKYLELCAKDQRMPKFANFLVDNGDGSFSLPTDNSERSQNIRKGYWKLLIDFKMYDNSGKGSPQTTVKPNFNMDRAMDVLNNYEGGANTLPTDHEVAQQFAKEYKEEHPGRKQYSFMDESDADIRTWMESVNENSLQTEAEKQLWRNFKGVEMRVKLKAEQERKIREEIRGLENVLAGNAENGGARLETMQNALEALGMRIVHTKNGKLLSYNGTVVGRTGGNWIGFTNGVPAGIRDKLEANGFTYDKLTNTYSYTNKNRTAMGETQIRQKLDGLQKRLEKTIKEKETAQDELAKITGSEGYAGLMYRQSRRFQDFQYGKTQAEVRDEIEKLETSAQNIARRIAENQEALTKLEGNAGVQRVRNMLGQTSADRIAADLKKQFASTWTKGQIRTYLDPILLKMSAGQEFMDDVRQLAEILVNSDSRNVNEDLSALRGLTITLGKGAQQELKARNSSLKEIRARLAGTGITVKYGDRSTLETDIEDLRAEYPNMPELGNEKDALENFVSWVEGLKMGGANQEFYEQRIADAIATVTGLSAAAADDIYLPADARARDQVLELVEYVKALRAETKQSQQALQDIARDLEKMQAAGRRASGMANTMTHDLNAAIDYYNKVAKIAEDTARKKTRQDIIQQLKSEHAQKIAKNNEEWRNLMERDRKARAVAEDNRQHRGQINTALKRMYDLLKNPKGTKNIPEHMQGVAREVIETIVNNDLNGIKLSLINKQDLLEAKRVLQAWTVRDGAPDISGVMDAESEDVTMHIINEDLMAIYDGIAKYNEDIRGKNKLDTLQQRGEILRQIQEAVSEIYDAIRAEGQVQMGKRKIAIEDAAYLVWQKAGGKKFREWTGKAGRALAAMHKAIVSGNMTPEYFFRTLGNEGLSDLWDNYHDAENRNGLELAKAKAKMDAIAEEHGYKTWDLKKKYTVETGNGKVEMTLGQIMSLWATWNREQKLGPEMSSHLKQGGFYVEQNDLREGMLGRTTVEKKAHRVDENDMARIAEMLTDEQKAYVNDVVQFMSNDMSELGNEASMAAYGIKLYKEKYYFPMQMWDGIKSRKSNDAAQGANIDRAFHPSFSKTRKHGANNALVIGDFTKTAADHIAGMINYATMGLANESLQKVLNYTVEEGTSNLDATKRNIRAILEETYGQEAMQYLLELQRQLNGGAVKVEKTFYDKLISLFRKNAVAGSLSVALQQPLSYIRAAMLVNPKYLAAGLNPTTWKGSYKEMMAHSGVAVIKDMGRFDMNFGQSAREYLQPDSKETTAKRIWNGIEEYSTILPELMDRMTWTRMWSACKAEMKAQNPDMDVRSDEFLDMVGERFNEVMRRTQVYDSVLVKSKNMRSESQMIKSLTSFMAEPTLTLNVLADAVRQAKNHEKGGMLAVGKAGATFLLSAVLQAAVKGMMGSGRTPDEKKTWLENFMYRFEYNFLNEADPLQLIPGFSDLVTVLKGGELKDDAFGTLKKMQNAGQGLIDIVLGNNDFSYRNVEDSAAQLMQLFTGVPAKNIMRDLRAMWNWTIDQPYAQRETSDAVLGAQAEDLFWNADNLFGVVNKWLGEAGLNTNNTGYYQRIYDAKKSGNEEAAQDMIEYLMSGKGVKEETINSKMASLAKKDESASAEETASFLIGEGADAQDYIKSQMKDGNLTAEDARKLLQENQPEKDADSIWWTVDRIEWAQENGLEETPSGTYYRLWNAMDANSATEIQSAVKNMVNHGVKAENIKSTITNQYKSAYLEADSNGKRKIRDAIQKAYKAAGFTAEDADKVINKWK